MTEVTTNRDALVLRGRHLRSIKDDLGNAEARLEQSLIWVTQSVKRMTELPGLSWEYEIKEIEASLLRLQSRIRAGRQGIEHLELATGAQVLKENMQ